MRIRNRKSYLSAMPEGAAPPNRNKTMTSRIYFAVLFAIAFYLLYVLANKIIFIESRGQVEVGRYLIHATVAGTIDPMTVKQGEAVKTGQPLITVRQPPTTRTRQNGEQFKASRDLELKKNEIISLEESSAKLADAGQAAAILPASILKLDNDARMKKIELSRLQEELKQLNTVIQGRQADQANRARLLELATVDPAISAREALEQQRLIAAIKGINGEIAAISRYREDLLAAEQMALRMKIAAIKNEVEPMQHYLDALQHGDDAGSLTEQLTAPIDGEIQAIFKVAGEQTAPGEPLLALRAPTAQVTVHGYFSEEQLPILSDRKKVKIIFPDGSTSQGVISNHYSIASSYREKLKNEYIPIKSAVLVEIIPGDNGEEARWRSFDRMDVTIRVSR